MWILTYRQFRHNAGRTALMVLAIGAVVSEILILEGFLAGMYAQLRSTVLNRGGDLVLTQAGISNFIAVRSILPQLTRLDVEDVAGVKVAHPLTAMSAIYDRDGRKTPIIILVFDDAGGPTNIILGNPISGDREIIIDKSLAKKYGFAVGDPIEISDFTFTIAGISANSSAFFTPFAFINYDDLIDFYLESEVAADIATFPFLSFLLVDIEPGADLREVAQRIEDSVAAADVFLPDQLAQKDEAMGRDLLGPILGLLLFVSYTIGALVVGMFMFTAVRARMRSIGVLKALGFGPAALSMAVFSEAWVLTLLAIPVGIVLAIAIASVITTIAPVYLILAAEPAAIARTTLAFLAVAGLGAIAPIRQILQVDPAIVFRG
ncbi:MAG: ABC transporter permease [Alphaproteobacteria bacterium]|nr:ABC transporter permease [Alphaproteobacteria bacterium]